MVPKVDAMSSDELKKIIGVSLSKDTIAWLDEEVEVKEFDFRSHGIEKAIAEYRKSKKE